MVSTLVYQLASAATVVVKQTILTVLFNPPCSCNFFITWGCLAFFKVSGREGFVRTF